jgi:hypothetical protein
LKVHIVCESCYSQAVVQYSMDDDIYEVNHCPFCGEDIDTEHVEELVEDDD